MTGTYESYDSEGKFIGKNLCTGGSEYGMANGHGRLNGHVVSILIAIIQVVVTFIVMFFGGAVFIRSVEKTVDVRMTKIDERMTNIENEVKKHAFVSKKNPLSMIYHHSLGVTCTKGCHIAKSVEIELQGQE